MGEDVAVTKLAQRGRFEITVGGEHAGLLQYVEDPRRRIFVHTETEDRFAGQGLAATLVRQALDQTRADGLRIAATCPYVLKFLGENPGWEDLVDALDGGN